MRIGFVGNFRVDYSSETHHAATLEAMGHQVLRMQETEWAGDRILAEASECDLLVWIHTHGWRTSGMQPDVVFRMLRKMGIPTVTYHLDLYLGIRREQDLTTDPFYRSIAHFFTVDRLMADRLNEHTGVQGHFLPAGVFGPECYISDQPSGHLKPYADGGRPDIVFVGSRDYHPEWPWRPQLIDWLRTTYGRRFLHVGRDGDTGTVRGDALNRIYAGAKVAVGDSLCQGFDYPWYVSDRLFEAAGRGAFQIFPHIRGITDWYREGEHLALFRFGDFAELKQQIDFYTDDANADERETIRRAANEHTKILHTYTSRWETILATVFGNS